jgi:hypothetical protein
VLRKKDGTITKPFTMNGGTPLKFNDWERVYFIGGNDAIAYLDPGASSTVGIALLVVGPFLVVASISIFITMVLQR